MEIRNIDLQKPYDTLLPLRYEDIFISMDQYIYSTHSFFLFVSFQGRSDGVSRVSNAYGPTAKRGPPKDKIHTRYFWNLPKTGKITNFGRFAYGPTRPSLRLCVIFVDSIKLIFDYKWKSKYWIFQMWFFLKNCDTR